MRSASACYGVAYRPRSSPDFNPIEQCFSKVTGALRRAEARDFAALCEAAGAALEAITPHDCRGFYRAAGYHLAGHFS